MHTALGIVLIVLIVGGAALGGYIFAKGNPKIDGPRILIFPIMGVLAGLLSSIFPGAHLPGDILRPIAYFTLWGFFTKLFLRYRKSASP